MIKIFLFFIVVYHIKHQLFRPSLKIDTFRNILLENRPFFIYSFFDSVVHKNSYLSKFGFKSVFSFPRNQILYI